LLPLSIDSLVSILSAACNHSQMRLRLEATRATAVEYSGYARAYYCFFWGTGIEARLSSPKSCPEKLLRITLYRSPGPGALHSDRCARRVFWPSEWAQRLLAGHNCDAPKIGPPPTEVVNQVSGSAIQGAAANT
jgi:hypothetical protein